MNIKTFFKPIFSGVYFDQSNKMITIVKDLKNLDYITCNVQDICHKELMSIGKFENYSYIKFDHEYTGPNCDPSIYSYGFGFIGGDNGIFMEYLENAYMEKKVLSIRLIMLSNFGCHTKTIKDFSE